jgi:hypothetical protein
VAVAAGAALAVTSLSPAAHPPTAQPGGQLAAGQLPAGHRPSARPGIQLAAWTVIKQPDGVVTVTVRELRNPAGLQRTLRADGIPASVTFASQMPRACHGDPMGISTLSRVYTSGQGGRSAVMTIHPSALPNGAGLAIGAVSPTSAPVPASPPTQIPAQVPAPTQVPPAAITFEIGLVHASPQCTGT